MESIKRELNTTFAIGSVSSTLTLSGAGVQGRPEMLDNMFAKVSKAVFRVLIPHFDESDKIAPFDDGETVVKDQLKLELLDHTLIYEFEVKFNKDFESPTKEALRSLIMEIMGPDVVLDAVGRIATRLKNEAVVEFFEKNSEKFPLGNQFDGNTDGVLSRFLAGRGRGGVPFEESAPPVMH